MTLVIMKQFAGSGGAASTARAPPTEGCLMLLCPFWESPKIGDPNIVP